MVPRSSVPTVSSPSPGQSADLSHALRAAASAVTAAAQAAQAAAQAAHAASVAAQLCSHACAASAARPRLASQGSQLLPTAAIEPETDSDEIVPPLLPPHTEQGSSYTGEAIKSTQGEFARPAPFDPRRPKTRPAVVTGQAFRRPAAVGVDGQLWARLALPDKSAQQEQKRLPDQAPHDATIYDAMYDIPPPLRPSDRPEINRALIVFLTLLIAFIVTLAVFLLRA